jgi:Protein of unknown function (DUF2442)
MPYITAVRYLSGYTLELTFSDGARGEVDLSGELYGRLFEPLRDVNEFRNVRVEPDLSTIVWSNGADLAPDYLYDLMQSQEHAMEVSH